jgi:AmmeMemoRadiSam system protein B
MRPEVHKASVRPAAVAGQFYPADPTELRETVLRLMYDTPVIELPAQPAALIVPHAGYIYSGPVAAVAYASIATRRSSIRRVVLIGPSHRVYLHGIAVAQSDAFATPLGTIEIDREGRSALLEQEAAIGADAPHASEHCLEVQLPFLQMLLDEFTILPLVVGATPSQQIADTLEAAWGGEETLVLISSDLSHYHSYAQAQEIDRQTSESILKYATTLSAEQACGAACINGLLHVARRRGFSVTQMMRLNSGDTAGDRRRVVGYGAYALCENALS